MTDAIELPEEDRPIWNENFSPPPWVAEIDEDAASDADPVGCEPWRVVCYGYDDETPIVCAGTKHWPLWREQALILAASLDTLTALRKAESFIAGFEGDPLQDDIHTLLAEIRKAIAKAEGDA